MGPRSSLAAHQLRSWAWTDPSASWMPPCTRPRSADAAVCARSPARRGRVRPGPDGGCRRLGPRTHRVQCEEWVHPDPVVPDARGRRDGGKARHEPAHAPSCGLGGPRWRSVPALGAPSLAWWSSAWIGPAAEAVPAGDPVPPRRVSGRGQAGAGPGGRGLPAEHVGGPGRGPAPPAAAHGQGRAWRA